LKATSLYHGLGVFTDNFNRLYNLNIGSNANNPITVRTALGQSNNFSKEMIKYFKELKQDVEGNMIKSGVYHRKKRCSDRIVSMIKWT